MDRETTRKQILHDDAFVLAEITRLQYLFSLHSIIRSGLTRQEPITTLSVAEHIYHLTVLAPYFLALEDPDHMLDVTQINRLITWHDVDEIETGDVIGFHKTDADRGREEDALAALLEKSPTLLHTEIQGTITEYKQQLTREAKFVKALDKIDPVIDFFNDNGKQVFTVAPATKEQHCRIKEPYFVDFSYINRFHTVTLPLFEARGFFSDC